jgi:predicted hydrocarbon binding protein
MDGPQLCVSSRPDRIVAGLESVVRLLELVSDMEGSVISLPREYRIRVSACPECAGRRSAGGACHGVSGMLRGALDWFGIDPAIPVTEVECIAGGAPVCEFSITGAF